MKDFDSIEGLYQEILDDKQTRLPLNNRYPTRLIFLPSFQILKEFVRLMDSHGVKKLELAGLLSHDDGWLTVEELINKIKMLNDNEDLVILPLSELVRFYSRDEFSSLFNAISCLENNNRTLRRRIYIPLVGIYERFNDEFFVNFYRKQQWAPIWRVQSNVIHKITIYIVDFHLNCMPDIGIIYNTKDWLNIWKSEAIKSVICVSKTLKHRYPNRLPDQMYDIVEIKNHKEFLSKIHGISLPVKFNENDMDYWEKLISIMIKKPCRSLREIITEIFGTFNIGKDAILKLWIETNEKFKKWLLRQYIISNNEWQDTYIYSVLNSLKEYDEDDFINGIWFKIFEIKSKTPKLYSERRQLIERLYTDKEVPILIEAKLEQKINSMSGNKEELKKIITGITVHEKKILIKMFINNEINLPFLFERYKELYYYLQEIVPDNLPEQGSWVVDYFKEYRLSKLSDTISRELDSILYEKNKNRETFYKWYYSFETSDHILQKENVNRIIWIDAMGMEWFSLLVNLIQNEMGYFIKKKLVARAYLPTITDCNRFENALYIRELDRDVHSTEPYRYPDSLIKDIEIMKKILQRNLTVSKGEKIAIVSDHGSTALARLKENLKIYDFKEAHHDGRCMWLEGDYPEDDELLIHTSERLCSNNNLKALLALRYTSLYKKPIREVHGGATPEEVLVPLIIISRTESVIQYEIIPHSDKITRRFPFLWLSIKPFPVVNPILLDERQKQINLEFDSKAQRWKADLGTLKIGKNKVKIKIGDFEEDIDIEISGGIRHEDELI